MEYEKKRLAALGYDEKDALHSAYHGMPYYYAKTPYLSWANDIFKAHYMRDMWFDDPCSVITKGSSNAAGLQPSAIGNGNGHGVSTRGSGKAAGLQPSGIGNGKGQADKRKCKSGGSGKDSGIGHGKGQVKPWQAGARARSVSTSGSGKAAGLQPSAIHW